jgi:heterodisulfide reductase subunit B2
MATDTVPAPQPMEIKADLARRVQEELGQNVYLCYQCVRCTSGCPLGEFFDWQPHQIMRALQLGQEDIALEAETPWLCASCQTCATRCPQNLDITAIMEFLTREALERGIEPAIPEVDIFNEAFLREIRLWGRAYELGLMAEMKLRTHNLFGDMDLAVPMLRRHKLPFLPSRARRPRHAKPSAEAVHAIAYYPGCSLHSTAAEFNTSSQAVAEALGMQLVEPDGWVCCGSTAAHRADQEVALRLPMENLSLIEQYGFNEVVMPCAACFNRHKAALYEIHHDEPAKAGLDRTLDYEYQDKVRVNTLAGALLDHVGVDRISAAVTRPLHGLRLVCYYGCLLTRPPQVTGAPHPENPTEIDELLSAAGAEVLDWSYKTNCCGAAHALTRPDIVLDLSKSLIEHARQSGADLIAVACPLCHANLDARQLQMKLDEPLPVLYFTQLLVLALGLPPKLAALRKNLVDPRPLLIAKGVLEAPA